MDKIQLKAALRAEKENVAKLRKVGKVPAVLYGHKVKNQSLSIDGREFDKVLKKAGESTVVDLVTDDNKTHPVLIHEVQLHYLTSAPIHVDFYEVSMTEKLKAKVALEFVGEAPAVKTLGGVLVKILNEIEVECLPADLPHNIEVSLEPLKTLTDSIHVKDIKIPAKVKVLTTAEEMVAKIQPPRDVEAELAAPVTDEKAAVEAAVAASEKPKAEGEAEEPIKEEKPKKE